MVKEWLSPQGPYTLCQMAILKFFKLKQISRSLWLL